MKNMGTMPVIFFIMGRPGSGKDTQADFLAKKFHLEFINTSDVLKEKFAQSTQDSEVLLEKANFDSGKLVNPPFAVKTVKEKIDGIVFNGRKGLVFSGSPRTLFEAEELVPYLENKFGKENLLAIHLEVSEEEGMRRIVEVRAKAALAKNPQDAKAILDNNQQAQKVRQHEYSERTAPVLDFFKNRDILIPVDGMPPADQVWRSVLNVVAEHFKDKIALNS